ncbi:MAG: glycosyltransferase [Candidatus Methanomethylicaceae archaeon]
MITSKVSRRISPYWMLLKRILKRNSIRPYISKQPKWQENGSKTFVMIVSPEFDQRIPNASVMARLGWCHGFEKIGIPYRIVSMLELYKVLPMLPCPICWLAESDYRYLTEKNLKILQKNLHIVWVNPWFYGERDYYKYHGFPNLASRKWVRQMVLDSGPSLVFTISPTASFEFYEQWIKKGLRLFSLPLAWDETVYPENPAYDPEYSHVSLAFVGGYWKYKARQLDRYLAPYANDLTVFGYSIWPYGKYGGLLPVSKEASLYRQAKVSPVINEPHVETMGIDLNERVFKVLGSGGFAVTDVVPGYREWFSEGELPVPQNEDEFHEIVHFARENVEFNHRYREAGHKAVVERHRYSHRASEVLNILNIQVD